MCKYDHYAVGTLVQITASGACSCGTEISVRATAKYQGHTSVRDFRRDVFELIVPVTCPTCSRVIERYLEMCQDENLFAEFINKELEL